MPRAALFLLAFAAVPAGCSLQGESSGPSDASAARSDGGSPCVPPCGPGMICHSGRCATNGSSDSSPADGGCVGTRSTARTLPLDMYVMLDQSSSMAESAGTRTKWSAVTAALKSFVEQRGMDGISVGLQLFGQRDVAGMCLNYRDTCNSDKDCGDCGPCRRPEGEDYNFCMAGYARESCDPAVYADPKVAIADIASVRAALANVLGAAPAGSYTPTSAALQGAIAHARAWATSHPRNVVAVVLASDGEPTECNTSLADINAIAAAGASGSPKILTFVIGVGKSLSNLHGIANAGGTSGALLVDTSGDVSAQFLAALNGIRMEAVGCAYSIPDPPAGQHLDHDQISVQFSADGASPTILARARTSSDCGARADAWHYDDPSSPKQVILCPATCKAVAGAVNSSVDVVLGCRSLVVGPD
jgi:hypothetical protein